MTFVSVTSGGSGSLGEADTPNTVRDHVRQPYSVATGILGIVVCVHWLGAGSCPYKPNY